MSQDALEHAALAAELSGDALGAVTARRALVQLDQRSAHPRLALAGALERAGQWREAVQAYFEALQRGGNPATIHLRLGDLQLRLAKHGPALAHLKKALAADPEQPEALFKTGIVLHRLRRFRDSADSLRRAALQLPDSAEVQFNLALARFECGDLSGALDALTQCRILKRGAVPEEPAAALAREPSPPFDAAEMAVSDVKLQHDLEQVEYLLGLGRLPEAYRGLADEYRLLLAEVRGISGAERVVPFNAMRYPRIARTYKRPIYLATSDWSGSVINPKLRSGELEKQYLKSKPQLVVVDNLLSGAALEALRALCRESTFWNNIQSGYLGAYFYDGFASGLLLRLAAELRERLPRVLGGHALQMLWGYKYDHHLQGIAVHADAAAVNVNFWITEDEANLEPEGGGLLVYPRAAPADWDFERFNRDPAEIMRFLERAGGEPIRVPHRANRAVIFDSDLFHATDRLDFREGYLNRRINITLLYGLRNAA